MPLVVVFGAYRRFELDKKLDDPDLDTITQVVSSARQMHLSLAFCRTVSAEGAADPGVWLPGCRPKVTDRVFEHLPGSAFESAAFSSVWETITDRKIHVTGPRSDSSMRSTVSDHRALTREVEVVIPNHPLQLCSTHLRDDAIVARMSPYSGQHCELSFTEWKEAICFCSQE
ncbi:MAG: hypothetical protein AAGB10_03390 [Pseudomonadota bacterium]